MCYTSPNEAHSFCVHLHGSLVSHLACTLREPPRVATYRLQENQALLERLLGEQRAKFEKELDELRQKLETASEEERKVVTQLEQTLEIKEKHMFETGQELVRARADAARALEEEKAEAARIMRQKMEEVATQMDGMHTEMVRAPS